MLYLILKTVHIVAMMTWLGGMLVIAVVMSAMQTTNGPFLAPERRLLQFIHSWDKKITTPAMLIVWIMGLAMAGMGHWFSHGWLQVKLPLAFLLSGLHGVQSGALQRMVSGPVYKPSFLLRNAAFILFGGAALAVFMAVVKPF